MTQQQDEKRPMLSQPEWTSEQVQEDAQQLNENLDKLLQADVETVDRLLKDK